MALDRLYSIFYLAGCTDQLPYPLGGTYTYTLPTSLASKVPLVRHDVQHRLRRSYALRSILLETGTKSWSSFRSPRAIAVINRDRVILVRARPWHPTLPLIAGVAVHAIAASNWNPHHNRPEGPASRNRS